MDEDREKAEGRDLLAILVKSQVISQAQADLVANDHQLTAMPYEDILLARHWVDEKTLYTLAPWLNDVSRDDANDTAHAGVTYDENLRKYRIIMAEILGESSE